jgi:hypothetical protein
MPLTAAEQTFESIWNGYGGVGQMQLRNSWNGRDTNCTNFHEWN